MTPTGPRTSRAARLLVVDSNLEMAALLRAQLAQTGYRDVRVVANVAEAAACLACLRFDAVLCGCGTDPDLSLAFVQAVRTHRLILNRFIPIIALVAAPTRDLVQRYQNAGVSALIARPASCAQIHERLSACLQRDCDYVECEGYFGPDRRASAEPRAPGSDRRSPASKGTPRFFTVKAPHSSAA